MSTECRLGLPAGWTASSGHLNCDLARKGSLVAAHCATGRGRQLVDVVIWDSVGFTVLVHEPDERIGWRGIKE